MKGREKKRKKKKKVLNSYWICLYLCFFSFHQMDQEEEDDPLVEVCR